MTEKVYYIYLNGQYLDYTFSRAYAYYFKEDHEKRGKTVIIREEIW